MLRGIIGVGALLFLLGCTSDRINHNGYEYKTSTGLDVLVSVSMTGDHYSVYILNAFTAGLAGRSEKGLLERQSMIAAREAVEKHTGCKVEAAEYNSLLTMVKVTVKCG